MEDIDDSWLNLTEKYVEKLHANENVWASLTSNEAELAALWKLETDMNNGGFMQFFCNWGLECYEIAVRGLQKIKAEKMRAIIEAEFAIVDSTYEINKNSINSYSDIGKFILEQDFKRLDELDECFWQYPESISELGFQYYTRYSDINGA